MKVEVKQAGVSVTSTGRLLSNEEVRLLAEIKKKFSPKIQATIKVVARYVRDTVWTQRTSMPSGYSIYSEKEGTYCSELMGVAKACIPPAWNPMVCWYVFLVCVIKSVYNIIRSEATRGMKRTAKGESKAVPTACFTT